MFVMGSTTLDLFLYTLNLGIKTNETTTAIGTRRMYSAETAGGWTSYHRENALRGASI